MNYVISQIASLELEYDSIKEQKFSYGIAWPAKCCYMKKKFNRFLSEHSDLIKFMVTEYKIEHSTVNTKFTWFAQISNLSVKKSLVHSFLFFWFITFLIIKVYCYTESILDIFQGDW